VLQCVAVCCSVLQYMEFMPVRNVLCLILNEWFAVRCTYASVAVCFSSGPVFFSLQHSCAVKCVGNCHNLKRPTKNCHTGLKWHRLKVFLTLHRREDLDPSDLESERKMQTAPASKFPVWSNRIPKSNGKIRNKKPVVCFCHTSFVSLKKLEQIQTFVMTVTHLKAWLCGTVTYVTKRHKLSQIWCDWYNLWE